MRARSLRIAVVGLVVIFILILLAVVLLFVLVRRLPKKDIGGLAAILAARICACRTALEGSPARKQSALVRSLEP